MEQTTAIHKIIHIDMDAFYASVEQLDHPELKGKPVAVGGNKERGVVAAASYEARKFGVRSAMPSVTAAKRCPHLIFIKPRFSRYKEISNQIREIFHEYTDLVEPLSLDEAYLDVTENKLGLLSATQIASEIRNKIKQKTLLTASAGVSYNKFLAKTASDINKPDGLFVIKPEDAEAFLKKFPIHKFFGIGKVTAEKMKRAGIFTGEDLRKKTLEDLILRYGKSGTYYYNICRGIDNRKVTPDRERKSISAENTFDQNLYTLEAVHAELKKINKEVMRRYAAHEETARTITVKIKYGDFKQITRSETLNYPIKTLHELDQHVLGLVGESLIQPEGIRLLGSGLSNFLHKEVSEHQLTLDF